MTQPKRLRRPSQLEDAREEQQARAKKQQAVKRVAEAVSGAALPSHGVRHFGVRTGASDIVELRDEIDYMTDVLLGRLDPPIPPEKVSTLMEVANAFYARGMEIASHIQRMETDGVVLRNSKMYKFRTGELRTFNELAKAAVDLGSRRITVAAMESEERYG